MSILWMDSFDFYGTAMANVGLRGYNAFGGSSASVINNNALARTGNGAYLLGSASAVNYLIRINPTPLNICVIGCAILWSSFPPSGTIDRTGLRFRIGTNNSGVNVLINESGGLNIYNGNTLVGATPNSVITANSYNWVEAKVISGASGSGSIEVRLNGVTQALVIGQTIGQITGYGFGRNSGSGQAYNTYFDDLVVNDTDFLGDRRIYTTYVNADTALEQWTPSSGTESYQLINESVPNDAGFITANNPGDISEFQKQPIPIDVNTVGAVCVVARAFKDSAGPSTFRLGVNSAGNIENSEQFTPNTTIEYFSPIFELNPNGNIPWTRVAWDAANVRATREL